MTKRMFARATLFLLLTLSISGVSLMAFDFSTVMGKISDFTLDNGMKFIVVEDHSAPVISFVLNADVGGVNDPKEYYGLAHVFEHLAFKGTDIIGTKNFKAEAAAMAKQDAIYKELRVEEKKGMMADSAKVAALREQFKKAEEEAGAFVEPNEFPNIIEQEGGVGLNAGTSYDNTAYYFSLPSNKAELWFALESSRFANPVFREIYKERDVIKEERRMRVESSPIGKLVEEALAAAFVVHPYGQTLVGPMSDIGNMDKETAMAFFKKYYVASNMVAAMAGDITPAQAKTLAEKYFGRLPKAPKPETFITEEPKQNAERRVAVFDKSQPFLLIGYHRPAATDKTAPIFDALSDHLGGGRTSLLYTSLVKEKKVATQASAFATFPGEKYPSLMGIFVVPAKGITADSCEKEVLAQVNKVQSEPISADKLEGIKARAKSALINRFASRTGLADLLASHQILFGDWRELFKSLDKINAVTTEDIQRIAKEYLVRSNRTVGYIETTEEAK